MSTRTRKFGPERTLFETHANDSFTFIFRTLFGPRGVLETSSARFGVGGARSAAQRHGEVFLHAHRRGQKDAGGARSAARRGGKVLLHAHRSGQEVGAWRSFSSVRVGVCEGAKRGEVFSPATCEVLFGSAARSSARRRAEFSSARAGGRRRGGARSAVRRGVRRVGVGEGAAACRFTNRRRGDVFLGACRCGRGSVAWIAFRSTARRRIDGFLGACRRGRRLDSLWLYKLRAVWGYWAAQWHLARAVGKRFRGCRAKRLYVDTQLLNNHKISLILLTINRGCARLGSGVASPYTRAPHFTPQHWLLCHMGLY